MKQTAAISALFIFVNSLSGLAGQLQKGINFSPDMYAYVGWLLWGDLRRLFWFIEIQTKYFKIFVGSCIDCCIV